MSGHPLYSSLFPAFVGSWIHPKEREEADRKASQVKAPTAPPVIPIASNPSSPPKASSPESLPKATTKRYHAPKQERTSRLSTVEKQELQNVKQLCLQVMKGQKRLVREVGIVKNAVQNAPAVEVAVKESVARNPSSEGPKITAKDMRELEEKQKRNLKSHLIALDMKEKGDSFLVVAGCALALFANQSNYFLFVSNQPSHACICRSNGRKNLAVIGSEPARAPH